MKIAKVWFKQVEYYSCPMEVPDDWSEAQIEAYAKKREEDFWDWARSEDSLETFFEEIEEGGFNGGHYISYEEGA